MVKVRVKMKAELPDDHILGKWEKDAGKENVFALFKFARARLEEVLKQNELKLMDAESEIVTTRCTGKCQVEELEVVPITPQEKEKFDRLKLQIEFYKEAIEWMKDDLMTLAGLMKDMKIKIKK
jgi:hypothetical protein